MICHIQLPFKCIDVEWFLFRRASIEISINWIKYKYFINTRLHQTLFGCIWHQRKTQKKNSFVGSKFISYMNMKHTSLPSASTQKNVFEWSIFPSLYISQRWWHFPQRRAFISIQKHSFTYFLVNTCWHLLMMLLVPADTFFSVCDMSLHQRKVKVVVKINISQLFLYREKISVQ